MDKKSFNTLYDIRIIIALIALVCTFYVSTHIASAQTNRVEELKQSISTREDDIKQLEEEIADYKIRLDNVGTQKKTLQSAVQTLDLSRAKLSKDIQLTQKKIERTNGVIRDLNDNITQKELRIEKNKRAISEIIHKLDQLDSSSLLEVVLSNSSISQFFEDADDLTRLQASARDSIKSLERLKQELNKSKSAHQTERKGLTGLTSQLTDQKQITDSTRTRQAILLSSTKNQESNYKKILSQRERSKEQFEKEIEDFEAQLRAEIDPNSFPEAGTKVLSYPLSNPQITQKFGRTVDARRLYVSGTHNGMDFRAAPGSVIMASAGGVVTATGDTDRICPGASYGRWVLVKHPNGLSTLYAHLELIKARVGQSVVSGDTLGYSGNTGYSTGPHLHFSVYVTSALEIRELPSKSCKGAVFRIPVAAANAYLDPQSYL